MDINEEIKRHEPLIKSMLRQFGVFINNMDYEDYAQELRIVLWESLKEYKEEKANERTFLREVLKNKLQNLLRVKRFMKKKPCEDCEDPCLSRCEKLTKWESEKARFNKFHNPLPIEGVASRVDLAKDTLKEREFERELTDIAKSILTPLEFEVFKRKILFYTQEEIGQELRLSQGRISQICESFRKKLKQNENLTNILPKKMCI